MKNFEGIWLPDGDDHFPKMLKDSPRVAGLPTYQLKKYKAVLEHVPTRNFAVDIGGHVGLWSRVMALDFNLVWAFEPLPVHRECFMRNTMASKNIELFPYALSDRAERINIYMPADNTGHAHASDEPGTLVHAVTLDSVEFPYRIDFLKIDVEGFELFVVNGGEITIRDHKPVIIVEQKPNGNAERYAQNRFAARDKLLSWGMKEVAVLSGDHILVWG